MPLVQADGRRPAESAILQIARDRDRWKANYDNAMAELFMFTKRDNLQPSDELLDTAKECAWALNWHFEHGKGSANDDARVERLCTLLSVYEQAKPAPMVQP